MGAAYRAMGKEDPHSPWLPPLPELLTLNAVEQRMGESGDGERAEGFLPALPLGLEDLPAQQEQRPMTWDFTRSGHLGIAGAPRTGRSSVLRGIAVAVAHSASAAEVHMYGIDAGNGALLPCLALPHVGAVVTRDQPDRVRRLLGLLGREVARRQQLLATEGFASLSEQRAKAPEPKRLPYLVLLIDRWDNFVATFENVDGGAIIESVESLMREGAAVGLRVVVAGDRTVFRSRFGMLLEDRLLLRMPSPDDFDLVGMRAREVPLTMPQGRAFRSGPKPREVQLALLTADVDGTAQVEAIHEAGRLSREKWGEIPRELSAGHVDELPVAISAEKALELGPPLAPGSISLAVGGDDLGLIPVSMDEIGNGVLVAGPRRSGRSTALLFGAQRALDGGTRVVLVLPRRSPLIALEGCDGVLGRLGLDSKPDDLRELLRQEPENTLIVIDDFEMMGGDHALGPVIEEHLRTCRDANGGVLVGCGIDEISGMYRGVVAQVRKTRTGLVLAPRSSEDGTHLSARLPRSIGGPVPKGRGVMVTTAGWSWVQVPKVD